MSNCYCHPGRAGGSPLRIRQPEQRLRPPRPHSRRLQLHLRRHPRAIRPDPVQLFPVGSPFGTNSPLCRKHPLSPPLRELSPQTLRFNDANQWRKRSPSNWTAILRFSYGLLQGQFGRNAVRAPLRVEPVLCAAQGTHINPFSRSVLPFRSVPRRCAAPPQRPSGSAPRNICNVRQFGRSSDAFARARWAA